MESMGRKKPRPRRSFTPEFKAEIVELYRRGDRSVGQIAKDFDLTETAVRDWARQVGGHGRGVATRWRVVRDLRLLRMFAVLRGGCGRRSPGCGGC